jgi:hypothetical protein
MSDGFLTLDYGNVTEKIKSYFIILARDQIAKINVISNDFVNSNSDTRLEISFVYHLYQTKLSHHSDRIIE